MILHLVDRRTWDSVRRGDTYSPASLGAEGFVHCTGDHETLLGVANSFYRSAPGEMVVLELDEEAVGSPVVWESPAHPDGRAAEPNDLLFPHVYGPLHLAAVRAVRTLARGRDGTFTGYGEADEPS